MILSCGWIDTHCHLTMSPLREQLDEIIARAEAAGVGRMITVATAVSDSRAAAALTDRHEQLFATVGIHPHESVAAGADDLNLLAELLHRRGVVAVGEVGLDYHYEFSPRDIQRRIFAAQLQLAAREDMPVVIHCRQALDDALKILADYAGPQLKAVFHCFADGPDEAQRILELGYYISFTGIVTFNSAEPVRQAARRVPLERMMLETDSPYLSPEPVRGRHPNEPANVIHVGHKLARLLGLDSDSLVRRTTATAEEFFNLPSSVHAAADGPDGGGAA